LVAAQQRPSSPWSVSWLQWCGLYKTQAPANLSRELLLRAVAYRMQEVALGGLRPARQRRLRQMAQQFKQVGPSIVHN
jgi:hypothetical protein